MEVLYNFLRKALPYFEAIDQIQRRNHQILFGRDASSLGISSSGDECYF